MINRAHGTTQTSERGAGENLPQSKSPHSQKQITSHGVGDEQPRSVCPLLSRPYRSVSQLAVKCVRIVRTVLITCRLSPVAWSGPLPRLRTTGDEFFRPNPVRDLPPESFRKLPKVVEFPLLHSSASRPSSECLLSVFPAVPAHHLFHRFGQRLFAKGCCASLSLTAIGFCFHGRRQTRQSAPIHWQAEPSRSYPVHANRRNFQRLVRNGPISSGVFAAIAAIHS